jgi:hypothetical protein
MLRNRNTNTSLIDIEWEIGDDLPLTTPHQDNRQPFDTFAPRPPSAKRRNVPRWAILPAIVLLAALTMLVITQRADAVVSDTKQDVLAQHRLLQQAVAKSDLELFDSMLEPSNSVETRMQRNLFRQGQFFDREIFGFSLLDLDAQNVRIALSEDLLRAQVSGEYRYELIESQATQTITLQQVTYYRRVGDGWKLTTGDTESVNTNPIRFERGALNVFVPRNEVVIGERLAADLGQRLREVCARSSMSCPGLGFQVSVQLSDSTGIMEEFIRQGGTGLKPSTAIRQAAVSMVLPAPSQIGLPIDEAGYRMLRDRYADLMVDTVTIYLQQYTVQNRAHRMLLAVGQLSPTDKLLQEAVAQANR